MTHSSRTKSIWPRRLSIILLILAGLVFVGWIYLNSLIGVDSDTIAVYRALRETVVARGYEPNFFVISGRRYRLDNWLLGFGGAARKSRHLEGDAIDIVVLDVNGDGDADAEDIDIVYGILEHELIGDKGGLGTYKGESGLFNRQMVHFDLRGHRARWHR